MRNKKIDNKRNIKYFQNPMNSNYTNKIKTITTS